MRVLITGGAGFIGSHLAEHYQNRAHVRILDNFRTGYPHNLDGLDVDLMEGSVCDMTAVQRAVEGVDLVYHLAAFVSVPESVAKPIECMRINVEGFLNVLEASARSRARKLLLASSAAIYGDNPSGPKVETMPPEPKSPYANTKLDGEIQLDLYQKKHGLASAALRFFNVFGPRQDLKSAYAAAVPIFMERALRGEPLIIFGDGSQTRDFIYVKDIVSALVFLAEKEGLTGVFNAGCGDSMTITKMATTIIRLAGSRSSIEYACDRAGDVRHSSASVAKLIAAGWMPSFSVEHGLNAMLAAFRQGGWGEGRDDRGAGGQAVSYLR